MSKWEDWPGGRELEKPETRERLERRLGRLIATRYGGFRSQLDPESILQRTFVKAFEAIERGAGPTENVDGWLDKILDRTAIDAIRQLKPHVPADSKLVHAGPGPSTKVREEDQGQRQRERLRAAIESGLTRPQQEVLRLCVFNDPPMTLAEAAEHMGKSVDAVAGLLKRAKETLRGSLKP